MVTNLDQQLLVIERNSKGWKSLTYYDRSLLQQLSTCLQACLAITSQNTFLGLVINRRAQVFDIFEYIAERLFKQWIHKKRPLAIEHFSYLTLVGTFNRRLALTLQNDNENLDTIDEEIINNLEHQKRVRELLFDNNEEIFDILMKILPTMNENEIDTIAMVLPWYESYMLFEHSYIDSTLDEKFFYFYQQIIQCLKTDEYERSLVIIHNDDIMITTVRHRLYLGICTMAMGIHVNCDENECVESKHLLELYLTRYINFIHHFLRMNQENPLNSLVCVTGIITYLVNYTLIIDNDTNRQLIFDLFIIILQETFHLEIRINWSTYETILIDSTLCYLIIYCFDNRLLVQKLLQTDSNSLEKLKNLVEKSQNYGNRRIAIMCQLFLLILTSCTKNEDLSQKYFHLCLTYIQMSLENHPSYHYNRIPMSLFFKSLLHSVKYDYIQEIIAKHYLSLLIDMIIKYDKKNLDDNVIYRECTMITLTILWSLSFNENIRKILKHYEQNFPDIIQKININTSEMTIKQTTCGLLYNLDRLDLPRTSIKNGHNYGKTIGISYDPSDYNTVQMIEQELNKGGHRVWTMYDHMNDHFIPSFISIMQSTQYLIVCLSDMYRLNNRCRTELIYATTSGHRVLSWKIQVPTDNQEENEQIRLRAIEALLNRVTLNNSENIRTVDVADVSIDMTKRSIPTNFNRRRQTKEIMSLGNWNNAEVLTWCQSNNLPGFFKLMSNFDGHSVMKLYELCKKNATETLVILNKDLHNVCQQDSIPDMQISVHEFIRFQIAVETLLSTIPTTNIYASSSKSLSSKFDAYRNRSKIKFCSIL